MAESLNQAEMDVELPYLDGESRLVLPPEPSNAQGEWYINDHCFIEDGDGVLHFFGINNPYPSSNPNPYTDAEVGIYDEHPYVGHAMLSSFAVHSELPGVIEERPEKVPLSTLEMLCNCRIV